MHVRCGVSHCLLYGPASFLLKFSLNVWLRETEFSKRRDRVRQTSAREELANLLLQPSAALL